MDDSNPSVGVLALGLGTIHHLVDDATWNVWFEFRLANFTTCSSFRTGCRLRRISAHDLFIRILVNNMNRRKKNKEGLHIMLYAVPM
jgi:hypothetical protein